MAQQQNRKFVKIEDKDLEIYYKNIGVTDYVVYNNKIYRIAGREGSGNSMKIILEKESTNERIWVGGEEYAKIWYILAPTGYMKI